jgi:hypothetical protein
LGSLFLTMNEISSRPIIILMQNRSRSFNRFLFFSIGWIIITTLLLTLPGGSFNQGSFFGKIPMLDKWVHIGLFGIMAMLFCRWAIYKGIAPGKENNTLLLCGLVCLAYGITMEFIQKNFIPLRSFDEGDIVANAVGSLLGIWFARRYTKK